ncbi:MAG: response regulator [Candidatus Omnitrophica bacterium]|nr:response regulator [Candidatus Omnitrophota bacterium]
MKILLVDDEPSIVKMVGKRLEIAGFQVVVAMDGEEALQKASSEKPDLIILDFMLPKKNGYEVCSLLKKDQRYQKIPVLLFTAKAAEEGEKIGAGCGADGYIRKPFQAQEFLDTIHGLIGKSKGSV